MSKGSYLPAKLPKVRPPRKKIQPLAPAISAQGSHARPMPDPTIEHCQSIFDNLLEGCQIIGFDWRYLYVNDSAVRHAQCSKADLLGYTMLERYPAVEKTALFALLQRCMQERTAATVENEFTYADQSTAWFELRIEPVPNGLLILSLDITERKEAEETYKQFLQATLDSFPANTVVLDAQGTIITANRPWKTFADTQQAQAPLHFVGTNYLTVCDTTVGPQATEAAATAAGIRAVIAGTQDDFYLGYTCHTPSQEQWFMLRVTPFVEPAPRRVVVAHIDITERRVAENAEHEQRLLAEALRDSLAALTTSLDVETVLQQILAYSATVIPSEAGAIVLFEGNQGRVAYARGYSPEAEAFFKTNLLTLDANVYAREAGKPTYYLATDTETTPYWVSFPLTAWIRSSVGVPIVVRGQPIGLLTADSATPNWFQPKHVAHLQTFAHYAALALENAQHVNQLEQRVQARTAELQAAKEQVEAILNNSADGILLIHTDLRIQQTNTAFHALVGSTPAAWVGQSLATFIHTEDDNAVRDLIDTAIAGQPAKPLELRAKRLDDTIFDAELSVGLIKGDGLVCTIRDITERKIQERHLRYHASLQKNVSDAVIVTDMASHIQSWNKAAERIYGWSTAEVIGKTTVEVLRTHFSSPTERDDTVAHLRTHGWWQGEFTQQHKNGTPRHILSSATLVPDENGNPMGVVAVNRDITERKQAEQALQQSAAAIHDLYNKAPCGYHSLDAAGVFVQINDTELSWLGYDRAEVLGKLKFSDLLTPESKLRLQQNFPQFTMRGWVNDLQFDMIRRDGSIMPILLNSTAIYDEHGHYVKSRSIVFDITELKQAQQALAKSEVRYRLLAENVMDVLTKVNLEGIRTFITPSCYTVLGYQPAELIGLPALDNVHPDDRRALQSVTAQMAQGTQSSSLLTVRAQHKAGHYIWVEITSSVLCDPATGKPAEIIGVVRDITERKRAEAVLAARTEEEREFQGYLKALHEITIELTQIDDLDHFYQHVVEFGLARLGFDRLALFLYDEKTATALGTYGVDPQRAIVSQSHVRFTPEPSGIMMRAFMSSERFCFAENVPLYSHHQPVGVGWNGATILWNGSQRLGWLVADNLSEQKPATKPLLDTLGLYGLTVGTLLAQKRVQIALRDSEARYRLLAENISDVVIHTNAALAFLYVSPSSYTVWGYTPAELLGQSVATYVHPDDLVASIQAITTAIAQKQPDLNLVLRFRHKQGHYLWLESNGRIVHSTQTGEFEEFIATSRDISGRKRAEAALQASEEKYRRLIDTMRGGLIMYDSDDRVSYINDRACELLGYQRHEIMGKRAYEYVDASAVEIVKAQLAQRRRLESSSYEVLARRKDGLPIHLLVSGSPLVDNQGAYNGCFVIAVDLTVQKQAEAALRQALAKEKELGELKSRFVSMASHEFRTPLATILALTETLSAYRHKLPDEQIEQRLSKIKDQISHLKGIMEDVLLLSRMQARRVDFHPVELDLDALCRDLLGEFQSPGDDARRLQYSSSGPIRPVQVDQKLMRQIISNLLSNAVKYSPTEKPIQISLQFTAEAFMVQVRDEGIGIPEADLKHLFEPFHRSANVGAISGTGLGLVITKEAVELHGGTITVDSQVKQGTTCTICIPIATKPQRTAIPDASERLASHI